jgi:hypothetical protein
MSGFGPAGYHASILRKHRVTGLRKQLGQSAVPQLGRPLGVYLRGPIFRRPPLPVRGDDFGDVGESEESGPTEDVPPPINDRVRVVGRTGEGLLGFARSRDRDGERCREIALSFDLVPGVLGLGEEVVQSSLADDLD